MLERALNLQEACDLYFTQSEAQQFRISPLQWEKVRQMVSFLQPLNDVTHFVCKSDYPTLNIALPMYISLIKDIILV